MLLKLRKSVREVGPEMSPSTFFTRQRASGNQQGDGMEITQFVVFTRGSGDALVSGRFKLLTGLGQPIRIARDTAVLPSEIPHIEFRHVGVQLGLWDIAAVSRFRHRFTHR